MLCLKFDGDFSVLSFFSRDRQGPSRIKGMLDLTLCEQMRSDLETSLYQSLTFRLGSQMSN